MALSYVDHLPAPQSLEDLLERAIPEPNSGCWLWERCLAPGGYGRINFHGRVTLAHRLAWQLANQRQVPEGLSVLHKCDTRCCIYPQHLFLGTLWDNMADMMRKGRQAHGERSGRRKLSLDSVRRIRELRAKGKGATEIAQTLDLNRLTVSSIIHGYNWKSDA